LLAHATQIDPSSKWWFGLDDDELAKVYPWEDWILAKSIFGELPEGMLETDLFFEVREHVSMTS
jgi:mycothiol S-conjugate amidase